MIRSVVVSLLTGWQEDPFYYDFDDPEEYNHSIEEAGEQLQLPADLISDIRAWDAEYQATYNPDEFHKSGFSSPEIAAAWRERGKELAARIKRESPVTASVDYQANGLIPKGSCMF
ncbi:hypothetical protein [Actinoalloteichus hymeniacidonis]|uniref:Uncharacterized protein n=1 Tax=Actinoalloteichus hymeniacidonis TaxID=340345 RepID=A0AAC9HL80_9PSEU|nr:hypothetical protein [Actinoalloteichus hymeniacidonis]AOS61224.1 hypothetical protein TL08_01925 [Actinoalloteichus hymeniacidonis]MBB5910773.1 hypothetical protein [Actinoalloteichus hymeniacidonis]